MIGLGFAEILMLALLGGGFNSTDLVAIVPPAHYFQSRNIDTSFGKMIELASLEPKDARTQVQQLVALRHLAEEAEKLKKDAGYASHRAALEAIAKGKKGVDPSQVAQEYAQRVLDKLDSARQAPPKLPPLSQDALGWFPSDVTFAAAADLRMTNAGSHDSFKELIKLIPEPTKKEIYDFVEKIGNLRIERAAMGMADSGNRNEAKIYIRLTGKGNQAWLADALKNANGRFKEKNIKDDKGTPITLLQEPDRAPVLMIVGNTDLLIFGYDGVGAKSEMLLDGILEARSGKKPNAGAGTLKTSLAKVPDRAVAFGIGDMPGEMKREFRGLGATPDSILAFAERTQTGLDLQLDAKLANATDTKAFVQKVGELRTQGITGLQDAMKQPLPPGTPPIPFQAIINMLETLQVQGQDGAAQVRMVVPDGLIQQMGSMGVMVFGHRAGGFDPPPPKKD